MATLHFPRKRSNSVEITTGIVASFNRKHSKHSNRQLNQNDNSTNDTILQLEHKLERIQIDYDDIMNKYKLCLKHNEIFKEFQIKYENKCVECKKLKNDNNKLENNLLHKENELKLYKNEIKLLENVKNEFISEYHKTQNKLNKSQTNLKDLIQTKNDLNDFKNKQNQEINQFNQQIFQLNIKINDLTKENEELRLNDPDKQSIKRISSLFSSDSDENDYIIARKVTVSDNESQYSHSRNKTHNLNYSFSNDNIEFLSNIQYDNNNSNDPDDQYIDNYNFNTISLYYDIETQINKIELLINSNKYIYDDYDDDNDTDINDINDNEQKSPSKSMDNDNNNGNIGSNDIERIFLRLQNIYQNIESIIFDKNKLNISLKNLNKNHKLLNNIYNEYKLKNEQKIKNLQCKIEEIKIRKNTSYLNIKYLYKNKIGTKYKRYGFGIVFVIFMFFAYYIYKKRMK